MTRSRQRAKRVLLVEDNPGDAELVRIALDQAEAGAFEVDGAATLSEALGRACGSPAPDVTLLDLALPDSLGLDGLRRLREAAPEVPIVVLTGSADGALGAAAIQAGAQDYLLKEAVDAVLLPRTLRHAVERHEHAARARLLAEERAARAAADAGRERMSLLVAASAAVSRSLEDRHALESLASAVVPRFADWCAIRTGGAADGPGEWIAAHRDAGSAAAVSARLDAAIAAAGSSRGLDAMAPSATELHQDGSATPAASPLGSALQALGVRSAIVVPVGLNDDVLGLIVFAASDRRFGPDDLAVAEEIGRRAGVALANCLLYREARLAVAARDEFLSVAAHELRTPVAVLKLRLQQAAQKQRASACGTCDRAVPADYTGAARQVSRLGHLVEELLDVSRLADRPVRLEREDLDLGEVARGAIDRLAALAERSRSEVALHCPEPVRGWWDRPAVERLIVNLLSNALKFGAGAPVEVRIRCEGAPAVIEVEDHGIGIAPEDVDRIFGQFERAVSSRHFGGLGLGLYVTRRLVEEHGGTIQVASRPGSGAVFTVRLPRADPHSRSA
jgi:signal transduction histidine kinase/DNA-binding NarL/FixJ family response regulator